MGLFNSDKNLAAQLAEKDAALAEIGARVEMAVLFFMP